MKKMIKLWMVCLTICALTVQTIQAAKPKQDKEKIERQAERRTSYMAKQFNLSEKQTKKLLKLNKKHAEALPIGLFRREGNRPENGKVNRPLAREGRREKSRLKGERRRNDRPANLQDRPQQEKRKAERAKALEKYNKGIRKIFTDKQYGEYEKWIFHTHKISKN